jgi:hypothetical protein
MLALACLVLAAVPAAVAAGPVAVVTPSPLPARAGAKTELSLAIEITPGFHVQANPAARPELIPLSVRVTDAASLVVGAPQYPPGLSRRLDVSPEPLSLYEGSVRVGLPIEVPVDVAPGDHIVRGAVRFQACDDRRCHLPATVPFAIAVRVIGDSPTPEKRP